MQTRVCITLLGEAEFFDDNGNLVERRALPTHVIVAASADALAHALTFAPDSIVPTVWPTEVENGR
jgi:hypothetical protein